MNPSRTSIEEMFLLVSMDFRVKMSIVLHLGGFQSVSDASTTFHILDAFYVRFIRLSKKLKLKIRRILIKSAFFSLSKGIIRFVF